MPIFQVSDEYAVTATTFHSQKEGDACGSAVLASIIHFCKDNNVSQPKLSVVAPSPVYVSCSEMGYQVPENKFSVSVRVRETSS